MKGPINIYRMLPISFYEIEKFSKYLLWVKILCSDVKIPSQEMWIDFYMPSILSIQQPEKKKKKI